MSWAGRRRAVYTSGVVLTLLVVIGVPLFFYVYDAPSCSDGTQNGSELGVDCGGGCQKLCAFQVQDPVVRFSRAFEVTPGNYSAVSYIENPNPKAAVQNVPYKFELYDAQGLLIAEREGSTLLLPNRVTPVFESDISTGEREPARTFFEFTEGLEWFRVEDRASSLSIEDRVLSRVDSAPRLDATLVNSSVDEFSAVDVVAVIFGTDGNAVAASKTYIGLLPKQSEQSLVFTWPLPFQKRVEACRVPADVMLLLDVSGSMNDDSANPPEPLTSAKEAAAAFVERLDAADRSGVVSFATSAALLSTLGSVHQEARDVVLDVVIDPEEERGSTNIGEAIAKADLELRSLRHNPDARRVIVLLTDGLANAPEEPGGEEYALSFASAAKGNNVLFYTIGLGDAVNEVFLRDIAGSESRTFLAASSGELDGIYREISAALCERGPAVIDVIPKTLDAFSLQPELR